MSHPFLHNTTLQDLRALSQIDEINSLELGPTWLLSAKFAGNFEAEYFQGFEASHPPLRSQNFSEMFPTVFLLVVIQNEV